MDNATQVALDWNAAQMIVAVVCAMCAMICASVCLVIWRKLRTGDLGQQIADGDARVKAHAEQLLGDIRDDVDTVRDAVARIESHQATEDRHLLRARDLSPLHEKFNRMAIEAAETRAQITAENRALGEQIKVLQGLVQNLLSNNRGSFR